MDLQFDAAATWLSELTPARAGTKAIVLELNRSRAAVDEQCRAIGETLRSLDDALAVVTHGSVEGQDWSGFGIVGLPIVGAIRAVRSMASQYVKEQTGVPLDTWGDFVSATVAKFDEYLVDLDKLRTIAERNDGEPDDVTTTLHARADCAVFRELRWSSQAWKVVLGRVAQVGQVVDAVLKADLGSEQGPPDSTRAEGTLSLSGTLQKRLKEAQGRVVEKPGGLGDWVTRPFVDLRDKVSALPSQVGQVSDDVALLEILLDLALAQTRATLGEVSAAQSRVVAMRVAAAVLLPELARDLAETRRKAQAFETYLARLETARGSEALDTRAIDILSHEYEQGMTRSRARLAELEGQAQLWRRNGPGLLDACADVTQLEIGVLAGRDLVEDSPCTDQRRVLLSRELARVDEARALLAAL